MNDLRMMYGPVNTTLPRPTAQTVKAVLDDFLRASENAKLAELEKKLKDALDRIASLERKSKRGRRRK